MRTRAAVLVAVMLFAAAVVGVAVIAERSDDDDSLQRLSYGAAAGGAEADSRAMASGMTVAGGVEYRHAGAWSDLPDEAPAYRLGTSSAVATVAALASVLGVKGEPTRNDERWVVRDGERELSVYRGPGAPWSLQAGVLCPQAPVTSPGEVGAAVCSIEATAVAGAPDDPAAKPPRPPGFPSRDDAERRAREVLAELGVPADDVRLDDAHTTWQATASPRVGGLPTMGWETVLSIGAEGVLVGGGGHLADPEKLGDYPLAGPEVGFERLQGLRGFGGPEPALGAPDGVTTPPVVDVTGAHLVLLNTGVGLFPAYVFETAEGDTAAVPAVTDRWLAGTAPEPEPVPEPGGGACSGTAGAPADDSDNAPLSIQVCGPTTASAGQEVVLVVTASDEDARIVEDGECGAPLVTWGDEGGAVRGQCIADCAAPLREGDGPGKFHRTYSHTYRTPGAYTVRILLQSQFCTTGSSSGEATHRITVR